MDRKGSANVNATTKTELTPLEDDYSVQEMFDYQHNRIYAKASF